MGDRRQHQGRISNCRQRHKHDRTGELRTEQRRGLDGKVRFAHAARPGDRHQTLRSKQACEIAQFTLTANQGVNGVGSTPTGDIAPRRLTRKNAVPRNSLRRRP
jgi:hypothetical protein